tara:strand:- start:666 stop:1424 length:759 start_codon:yes stop_codon:yes gene_type:complete
MLDFNNPYLGKQEIADMLCLETSPEYKQEKAKMYAEGFGFSSPSYWKMSASEFSELLDTSAAIDIETLFQYKDTLGDIHPDCDILLMEHDRVEAGEYDRFYQKFMPIGYQNVCAIAVMGILEGEVPKNIEEMESGEYDDRNRVFFPQEFADKYSAEELSKYELTMSMLNNSTLFYPLGIYDIALPVLNLQQYEEKRIYKRTYIFSKYFEKCMKGEMEKVKKILNKGSKKKKKSSTKGFNKKALSPKKRGKKK